MTNPPFGDLLEDFVTREKRSANWIAEYINELLGRKDLLSRKTIESWLNGAVRRPRDWKQILYVAQALDLTAAEADQLLQAAGHQKIALLRQEAESQNNAAICSLLAFWEEAPSPTKPQLTMAPPLAPVFQVVPKPAHLIGRKTELAQLCEALLGQKRVTLLYGMPGVGKTALAIEAAYRVREHFPDGVLWAQLDRSDAMSILFAFAAAYGVDVREYQDIGTRSAMVRNLFANKRALIVLDSSYSANEIHDLLPPDTSPSAVLVTTTNGKLLENVFPLELKPFDTADPTDGLALFRTILPEESVARQQTALVQLIRLVGGLPMALRVIASEVRSGLTAAEYLELLLDERARLEQLTDWNDTTKDVRAAFEVSYRRLTAPLPRLFSALAVFKKAEFPLEAVAAIWEMSPTQAKRILKTLQALSLIESYQVDPVIRQPGQSSNNVPEERYRLHTLLALFVNEKLATEREHFQTRAATFYLAFAQRYQHLYPRLAVEWENLADLLTWAQQSAEPSFFVQGVDLLTAPRLGVLGFLEAQGHWRRAQEWLQHALALPELATDALKQGGLTYKTGAFTLRLAQAATAESYLQQALDLLKPYQRQEAGRLLYAYVCETLAQLEAARNLPAALAWSQRAVEVLQGTTVATMQQEVGYLQVRHATVLARSGELDSARQLIEAALGRLPTSEPTAARISALLTLGNIYDLKGQPEQARDAWQQGVTLAEALGDNRRLAGLWLNLAIQADEQGHFALSAAHNQKALDLYQRIGDIDGKGRILCNLALLYLRQEQPDAALPYLQAATELTRTHALDDLAIHVQINYARWHLLREEFAPAQQLLEEALGLSDRLGESEALIEAFRLLAQIAFHRGDYRQAQRWIEEALTTGDDVGNEAGLAWGLKGEILCKLGETGQARVALQHSIELLARYPFDQAKVQLLLTQCTLHRV